MEGFIFGISPVNISDLIDSNVDLLNGLGSVHEKFDAGELYWALLRLGDYTAAIIPCSCHFNLFFLCTLPY